MPLARKAQPPRPRPLLHAHTTPRSAFKKRVDEFLEEEKKELDLRDLAIARAILESDTRWEDDAMDEDFPLRMTVYIYGR